MWRKSTLVGTQLLWTCPSKSHIAVKSMRPNWPKLPRKLLIFTEARTHCNSSLASESVEVKPINHTSSAQWSPWRTETPTYGIDLNKRLRKIKSRCNGATQHRLQELRIELLMQKLCTLRSLYLRLLLTRLPISHQATTEFNSVLEVASYKGEHVVLCGLSTVDH